MNRLPEPDARQPHAPQAGQPINPAALEFLNDIESVLAKGHTTSPARIPTSFHDPSPVPAIGLTPPVPQPGRPPMSQKATDASALMLSAGLASLPIGAAGTGILWASGHANPTVIGLICTAPAALAFPILALSRLVKRAKQVVEAASPVHHHHYTGAVHQDHRIVNTQTRGIWASTRNQLPPAAD